MPGVLDAGAPNGLVPLEEAPSTVVLGMLDGNGSRPLATELVEKGADGIGWPAPN